MAKISARKLKEIEAAEQKFRPLDTPKTSRPFPNLGMEKPAAKKKTTKANGERKGRGCLFQPGMEAREGDVGGSGHRRNSCDRA